MGMIPKTKNMYEKVDDTKHLEHQERNTRVSEYLKKYGVGKLEDLPTDNRPTITDERTVDEMLDDERGGKVDLLAFDELDALSEFNSRKEEFEKMRAEIDLTEKQSLSFDRAMSVLNSANASRDDKQEALAVLEELQKSGKVTHTRARKI